MATVLISHHRADGTAAKMLAGRLTALGCAVSLDDGDGAGDIGAGSGADAVIGLWTASALAVPGVRKVCDSALHDGRLVAVAIGPLSDLDIPARFASVQYVALPEMSGAALENGWVEILQNLGRVLGDPNLVKTWQDTAHAVHARTELETELSQARAELAELRAASGASASMIAPAEDTQSSALREARPEVRQRSGLVERVATGVLLALSLWLVAGMIEFGVYQYRRMALDHAVYEGARNVQSGEYRAPSDFLVDTCKSTATAWCAQIEWTVDSFSDLERVEYRSRSPLYTEADRTLARLGAAVSPAGGADMPDLDFPQSGEVALVCGSLGQEFVTPGFGMVVAALTANYRLLRLRLQSCTLVVAEPW